MGIKITIEADLKFKRTRSILRKTGAWFKRNFCGPRMMDMWRMLFYAFIVAIVVAILKAIFDPRAREEAIFAAGAAKGIAFFIIAMFYMWFARRKAANGGVRSSLDSHLIFMLIVYPFFVVPMTIGFFIKYWILVLMIAIFHLALVLIIHKCKED